MVRRRVAIIGCGPRGLGLLERLIGRAAETRRELLVHVVEPGALGVGMHLPDQPDYLLLNTVCAQLTAFTDRDMLGAPVRTVGGPSLYEWCRQRDVRIGQDGGLRIGMGGRPVEPADHLPRRLLGDYLGWAAERIVRAAPEWVEIRHHRQAAAQVRPEGAAEQVVLADGGALLVDQAVVTVGHGDHEPGADGAAPDGRPYPLPAAVATLPASARVALLGVGLTGMDVLAALTVGRGGSFHTGADGRLRYAPSGQEPTVVLVSREGRPARARPRLTPGRRPEPARHLTAERIAELRADRPGGRLDFETDVLPLVLAEMAHRWTVLGGSGAQPDFRALLFGEPPAQARRHAAGYRRWYVDELTEDLRQARRGLGISAVKESLEVLRDHREVLRAAVDGDGLTEASRDWFYGRFTGAANRLVIGPQLERHDELLALLAAGVVELGPGPAPSIERAGDGWRLSSTGLADPEVVEVAEVVTGHSAPAALADSPNPLLRALTRSGRLSPVSAGRAPLGARVDRLHRAVDAGGHGQPRLFLLGPLAEGSSYYNHYVVTPNAPSRATRDAHAVAATLLDAPVQGFPTTLLQDKENNDATVQ
ncbi:FAD/NAD(P)-binding protein [Solihabitans fulvus]|uniref:FAD/NAD(P)-binding protein n=1 Tax=Solihabitans fulvus TaxID=1892852 RepID=A0A5B2WNY3_9PSEU|nr:FAD/NAD(P)-binding protein [Solihabitans fulvus]KAA2252714.1 FAD/NAD(P)-binding protein [Solihabitans fulvus]